jgi:hypothetical protein
MKSSAGGDVLFPAIDEAGNTMTVLPLVKNYKSTFEAAPTQQTVKIEASSATETGAMLFETGSVHV